MSVMNQQVRVKRTRREVVHAARAVGDVTEDETVGGVSEGGDDVGDDERVHEEAFGELEGDALGARGGDAPDGFVDFEGVVWGEEGDGGV